MSIRTMPILIGLAMFCAQVGAQPCDCSTPMAWDAYCAPTAPGYGQPSPCVGAAGGCGAYGGDYTSGGYRADTCAPPAYAPSVVAPAPVWVLSVGALVMDRNDGDRYTFSYDDPNEELQYLDQREAGFDWAPGFEVRLTRINACTGHGTELVYWQLFPSDQSATVLGSDLAGNLSAILNYDQLDYNAVTADNYTNNAYAHRLRRDMNAYNVEANHLLAVSGCGGCGGGPTVSWITGLRVFRLDEGLEFASDPTDAMFTYETDELYYTIDTSNTLVGGQLGAYCCCPIGCKWSTIAGAKAGLFANFAESNSRIAGAAGTATINNGAYNGRAWMVENDKTDVAMMAELLLGVACQATPCWRFSADYRVVSVSGVALPTDQIYPDLRGINDVEQLNTDGQALFHGGFLSVERLY